MPEREEDDNSIFTCSVCEDINQAKSYFLEDGKLKNGLRILHQNIRSYNRNFDEFLILLQGLDITYHCLVLTECWLSDDTNILQIRDYNVFRSANSRNASDGVVVYVHRDLPVSSCSQLTVGGVATALALTFAWQGVTCDLLATYRGPNTSLAAFIDGISTYCNDRDTDAGRISILTGDTNCNILNVTSNSQEERYVDMLINAGFISCVDGVTRPASGSCLDHFFVKVPYGININPIIIHSALTDHYSTCLEIYSSKYKNSKNKTFPKNILKTDWNKVRKNLVSQTWNLVTETDDINESVNNFINTITEIISSNSEKLTSTCNTSKIKPWITFGLVKSIRYRDKLYKKLNKQPFNDRLRSEYTRYRNTLHSVIKRAKFNYYQEKIQSSNGNPRKFWHIVNEVAGRSVLREPFPVDGFVARGEDATPDQVKIISNTFNTFFASVGSRLASALNTAGPAIVDDSEYALESVFDLRPVTQKELAQVIRNLKGRSAPGWDSIPSRLIKDNIRSVTAPLLHIINLSIRSGQFPDALKIATVVPIYKSGIKYEYANFRPISLLSVVSKILERCVKNQLVTYLHEYNIISPEQYGFQRNKNTSDALFDFTKFISQNIGVNNRVLITFLDIAKAFDCVDRLKLLAKLELLGFKNKVLAWFSSFLENRLQKVAINGVDSDMASIDYGVIQGSTLGPLLFLLYVNNITKVGLNGKLFLFADDTALVSTGGTWDEVYMQASQDLMNIKSWFDFNSLTVNISKTKCLPIFKRVDGDPGPRTLRLHSCADSLSVNCGCETVERVDQYTYLGIIIDRKLNWAPHVQQVKQRLRRYVYAFRQLTRVLSVKQCRIVYYAYVQSVLLYGILAWGGASANVLEPLAVTQRAIIKSILRKPSMYPTLQLFEEFPVHNIRQLFIKTLLLYIRNNKKSLFTITVHNYSTRNRANLGYQTPRMQHSGDAYNSFYISQQLYKNVPLDIVEAEEGSVSVYKRKVSEWLFRIGPVAAEVIIHSTYV